MPFREQKHKCRALFERALHEYVEFGEKHILHDCICLEDVLCWGKYAKLVHFTHEAYHSAIELDSGMEMEWPEGHDHDMPNPIKAATAAKPQPHA